MKPSLLFRTRPTPKAKISSATHIYVTISYDGSLYFDPKMDVDAWVRKQMKHFDGVESGCGAGFGLRDISFYAPRKAKRSLKTYFNLFDMGVDTEPVIDDDDDDAA